VLPWGLPSSFVAPIKAVQGLEHIYGLTIIRDSTFWEQSDSFFGKDFSKKSCLLLQAEDPAQALATGEHVSWQALAMR